MPLFWREYMRTFAGAWPKAQFGQQPVAQMQITGNQSKEIEQQLVARIPWGHHTVLMDKLETRAEREFYLAATVENNWSRSVLLRQIETGLYHRKGMAITNFNATLPTDISDLARETLNNPYILEFTGLSEQVQERELEKALITHMQKFLLELGREFAFVGRQSNIVVDGDDFFLDLLFFNYQLNCFVIFELKVGEFVPEFAGKLNFYVNTVNAQLKGPDHKPTIGVLLCKTPNRTVVQYSLTGIDNPIGVADYEFVKALPKELKTEIPTMEELEAEIDKEYEELKSPAEKRLQALKEEISNLKIEVIQAQATFSTLCNIFDQSLTPLYAALLKKLSLFHDFFMEYQYGWLELPEVRSLEELGTNWKNEVYLKNRFQHNFQYRLEGFKAGGPKTFAIVTTVSLYTDTYSYSIATINYNNHQPFLYKLYHQQLTPDDIDAVCTIIFDQVYAQLESRTNEVKKAMKEGDRSQCGRAIGANGVR